MGYTKWQNLIKFEDSKIYILRSTRLLFLCNWEYKVVFEIYIWHVCRINYCLHPEFFSNFFETRKKCLGAKNLHSFYILLVSKFVVWFKSYRSLCMILVSFPRWRSRLVLSCRLWVSNLVSYQYRYHVCMIIQEISCSLKILRRNFRRVLSQSLIFDWRNCQSTKYFRFYRHFPSYLLYSLISAVLI
jgi:hypothetical protein